MLPKEISKNWIAFYLVESVEPDGRLAQELLSPPDDLLYFRQWPLFLINAPAAWQALQAENGLGVNFGDADDKTYGSADVVIGIADNGIGTIELSPGNRVETQADFSGRVFNNASKVADYFNYSSGANKRHNDGIMDDHGMMCASVAAGSAGNNPFELNRHEGVVGVAPNARLMGIFKSVNKSEFSIIFNWVFGNFPRATLHPMADSVFTIAVGGTSLDNNGKEEVTTFSGYGSNLDD